jgi:ribosomal protein L11 methylase PrmA
MKKLIYFLSILLILSSCKRFIENKDSIESYVMEVEEDGKLVKKANLLKLWKDAKKEKISPDKIGEALDIIISKFNEVKVRFRDPMIKLDFHMILIIVVISS